MPHEPSTCVLDHGIKGPGFLKQMRGTLDHDELLLAMQSGCGCAVESQDVGVESADD